MKAREPIVRPRENFSKVGILFLRKLINQKILERDSRLSTKKLIPAVEENEVQTKIQLEFNSVIQFSKVMRPYGKVHSLLI